MRRYSLLIGLAAALGGARLVAPAQEVYREKPTSCEPGFRLVQETTYQEVEHPVCKVVPDKRSKWIYCTRPDYFCVPACPLHCGHHPDGCDRCRGPFCRQQLLKKKVEWECGTKCVVEIVKEKVPTVVWRKVPCAPGQPGQSPAPELLPPPSGHAPPPVTDPPR